MAFTESCPEDDHDAASTYARYSDCPKPRDDRSQRIPAHNHRQRAHARPGGDTYVLYDEPWSICGPDDHSGRNSVHVHASLVWRSSATYSKYGPVCKIPSNSSPRSLRALFHSHTASGTCHGAYSPSRMSRLRYRARRYLTELSVRAMCNCGASEYKWCYNNGASGHERMLT